MIDYIPLQISFKKSLYLKKLTGSLNWETTQPFTIIVNGPKHSQYLVKVKKGFKTDLASVPKALWSIFPNSGKYTEAAVVHDYMYYNAGTYDKGFADAVFHQMLCDSGLSKFKAYIMLKGVTFFGGSIYNKYLENRNNTTIQN